MTRSPPYRVDFAQAARDDLVDIARAITKRESAATASRVLDKLRKRALSLKTTPRRGRYVPELVSLGIRTWRELISGPYAIMYRVDGRSVLVAAVVDRRRDLRDLLQVRLTRPM